MWIYSKGDGLTVEAVWATLAPDIKKSYPFLSINEDRQAYLHSDKPMKSKTCWQSRGEVMRVPFTIKNKTPWEEALFAAI